MNNICHVLVGEEQGRCKHDVWNHTVNDHRVSAGRPLSHVMSKKARARFAGSTNKCNVGSRMLTTAVSQSLFIARTTWACHPEASKHSDRIDSGPSEPIETASSSPKKQLRQRT